MELKQIEQNQEEQETGLIQIDSSKALRHHKDDAMLLMTLIDISEMVGENFSSKLLEKIAPQIRKLFPSYSIDDVKESFEFAILGIRYEIDLKLYGQNISLKYFSDVFKLYRPILAENIAKKELGKNHLSDDDKRKMNQEAREALAIKVLSLYVFEGDLEEKLRLEIIHPLFTFLDGYGLLDKNSNVRWGFYFTAKDIVKSELLTERSQVRNRKVGSVDPKDVTTDVRSMEIQSLIDSVDSNKSDSRIIARAKRLQVLDFFSRKPIEFKVLKNLITKN